MAEDEKRIAARRKVLKAAKIIYLDKKTVIDCTIRDLSETGAKLNIENQASVPKEFYFFSMSDGTMRPSMVIWRREKQIGVNFTGEAKPAPSNLSRH
jgi:hypothetical protein